MLRGRGDGTLPFRRGRQGGVVRAHLRLVPAVAPCQQRKAEAKDGKTADVRLWVAGDGPETCMLQQQTSADTRVEWLGRIDDDELARRLRGADVFCAPSLYGESFGVVLLEAMAAQTPIVASDLPGYRNVARRGQDALLVEPGDARALAEALGRLLEQPTLSETLVASGEARAAEFSMDRLAERYLDFYDSLAA